MALKLTLDGEVHAIEITRRRPYLVMRIDGREYEIAHVPDAGDGRQILTIGGVETAFARARLGDSQIVRMNGRTAAVGIVNPLAIAEEDGAGQDALRAPMPGAVVSVDCAAGSPVKRGETVITIESMKLQTALAAPRDGTVAEILRTEGQTFEKDDVLVMLEPIAGEN